LEEEGRQNLFARGISLQERKRSAWIYGESPLFSRKKKGGEPRKEQEYIAAHRGISVKGGKLDTGGKSKNALAGGSVANIKEVSRLLQ